MTELMTADVAERQFAEQQHRDLVFGLAQMSETIAQCERLSGPELWARLHRILTWVHEELEPHAGWEEAVLYRDVDRLAGTDWATKLMRFEHRQIQHLVAELEGDAGQLVRRSTRPLISRAMADLAAFQAVLTTHIEREERFLVPLLDE